MKFCLGTLANILFLCGVERIGKRNLCNALCKSVDPSCNLSQSAVTALLQCTSNLSDGRSNGLGNVISGAKKADPQKVAEYFAKNISAKLLDNSKRKLAVLAIRELIAKDESIGGSDIVEIVSGTSKNALILQSRFALSRFLAGVFLFAVQINNNVGKIFSESVDWDFVVSFEELQDTISFVVPQKEGDIINDISEVFVDYLENVKSRYENAKTMLCDSDPTPLYDFYVPNHAVHAVGRAKNEQRIDVSAESLTSLSNFLIVEGIGGLGKTLMMQHLLCNSVDNFIKLRLVPIFIPLKDFSEKGMPLDDFVFSETVKFNRLITKEDFTAALDAGLFLLLFDGLDEIEYDHADRFEREIECFTDQYPKNFYVVSSRPFQSFVSFARFSKVKLQPFLKGQALEFVDKVEFRPDKPEIKERFRAALDKSLYNTHRTFAQNPLLLTIMLLTFERFAEIPSKMHIFYREAFLALSVTHDATKGGYKRPLKTGLHIDTVEMYFAEVCFRSYRDEKYEFTTDEFAGYFDKLSKVDKSKTASDFLYDLCHNLCLMYFEGGKYRFIHRSFQEYFAAVFMSRQTDEFIGRLGNFFEKRSPRVFANSAFPMLYDIIPERVEQFIFTPFLSDLFAKCDSGEGYWTYLDEEFPVIYYENGEVEDFACNDPQSYMLEFIIRQLDYRHTLSTDDLPFYDSLVAEEILENTAPILVEQLDVNGKVVEGMGTIFTWPYYDRDEDEPEPEPEVIGYKLEFDIADVRKHSDKYSELLAVLDKDGFVLKCQYNAAKTYLNSLINKIRERRDDLIDLL